MKVIFSEEAQHILKDAKREMQKLKHAFIGSEHLLLSILKNKNFVRDKLNNYGVNYDLFLKKLVEVVGIGKQVNEYFIYTPLLKRVLEEAILDTKEINSKEVSLNTIFLSMLDEGEGVGIRVLNSFGIDLDNLYEELNIGNVIKNNTKKLLINECSVDLTKKAKNNLLDPLIGRDNEVSELIEIILRRNKNNPLLIGEAGVGKTAIVEELARRIVNGDVPLKLKNMKILSLSMASCVSGTKYRGEFEERVTKIIKELEDNKDLIVFIDEIHTLVGAGGAEGAIDASNILKPALARGNIKVIGATTINEYKDSIAKDKALSRRFQTIIVKENTIMETKEILHKVKGLYEEYHHVIISDDIINKLVDLTDKYIIDKKNPDKSLDVLDTVCAKVSLKKNNSLLKISKLKEELKSIKKEKNDLIMHHHYDKATIIRDNEMEIESRLNKLILLAKGERKKTITIVDIANVLESKTNIPIYEINSNTNKIKKMEDYLEKKIIGQNNVIKELSNITKKIMYGFKSDLPYSILFVGQTGVGKTALVKEYSKYLKIPLIRLDMGDYKEAHSISKIIGSPPGYVGYDDYDNVLEKVKNNPYSVILLDEIEKAHHDIINVFLNILDEGIVEDSHGNKVNFKNTIIIMTSNIKYDEYNIGFNQSNDKETNLRDILSTAFVNRINKICYFNNLDEESIRKIIKNRVKEIVGKYQKYDIKITISNNIINDLVKNIDYHYYGARKINKALEDKIDNLVIDGIINKKKVLKI